MKSRKLTSKGSGSKGGNKSRVKRGDMTPYEGLVYVVEEMKRIGGPIWIAPLDEVIRDLATS